MQYNSPEQFGEMPQAQPFPYREIIENPKTPEEIFHENQSAVIKKAAEAGIILDGEMRIAMNQEVFPNNDVSADIRRADFAEQQSARSLTFAERKAEAAKRESEEKLSSLIVINFNKFLGEDFLVAKTARYDKALNGADIVIFNKKTGDLVCAFGGIGALGDSSTNEEMLNVFHKNLRSSKDTSTGQEYYGMKLAYGLAKDPSGAIKGEERMNVPAFFIAEEKNTIKKAFENLSGAGEKTESEKDLFSRLFFQIAGNQAETLVNDKRSKLLNDEFKGNLNGFWKFCKEIKQKYGYQEPTRH